MQKLKLLLTTATLAMGVAANAQSDNRVTSDGEIATFIPIDLSTSTWSTARGTTPGFMSAVDTGSYINASDASNINGYAKFYAKAANQSYMFPVGSGTDLRRLWISGSVPATGVFATAWMLGNPSTNRDSTDATPSFHDTTAAGIAGTTIKRVSGIGQWDWMDISNNAAGATVKVSLPNMTSFAPKGHLRLVGWDATQSKWIALGTTGATGNVEDSTLTGTMAANIKAIGIGSIALGLPNLTLSYRTTATTFSIASSTQRDVVLDMSEAVGNPTDKSTAPIRIVINKNPSFDYTFDNTATTASVSGSVPVSNTNWSVSINNASVMVLDYIGAPDIPGYGYSSIAIKMKVKSTATPGGYTTTYRVNNGSGAEAVTTDNITTISITIN